MLCAIGIWFIGISLAQIRERTWRIVTFTDDCEFSIYDNSSAFPMNRSAKRIKYEILVMKHNLLSGISVSHDACISACILRTDILYGSRMITQYQWQYAISTIDGIFHGYMAKLVRCRKEKRPSHLHSNGCEDHNLNLFESIPWHMRYADNITLIARQIDNQTTNVVIPCCFNLRWSLVLVLQCCFIHRQWN